MLPEPVRAVDRLVLGGGVPPWVHEEDARGDGEIERDAARLGFGWGQGQSWGQGQR